LKLTLQVLFFFLIHGWKCYEWHVLFLFFN
jgi:hypothetical protein